MQFIFCVYNAVKTDFQHSFCLRALHFLPCHYKLPKRNRVSRKENILVLDAAADGTLMEIAILGRFPEQTEERGLGLAQEVFFVCQNKTDHFDQGRFSSLRSCCILMIR